MSLKSTLTMSINETLLKNTTMIKSDAYSLATLISENLMNTFVITLNTIEIDQPKAQDKLISMYDWLKKHGLL